MTTTTSRSAPELARAPLPSSKAGSVISRPQREAEVRGADIGYLSAIPVEQEAVDRREATA